MNLLSRARIDLSLALAHHANEVIAVPLTDANVYSRWNELGYTRQSQQREVTRGGIARYMARERCVSCDAKGVRGTAICAACADGDPNRAALTIAARGNAARTYVNYCQDVS